MNTKPIRDKQLSRDTVKALVAEYGLGHPVIGATAHERGTRQLFQNCEQQVLAFGDNDLRILARVDVSMQVRGCNCRIVKGGMVECQTCKKKSQ